MNRYQLIFKEIHSDALPIDVNITCAPTVFKQVRHAIKPCFPAQQLHYENFNGGAAQEFNRRIGRHKSDWLPFVLQGYTPVAGDYPDDDYIFKTGLIQETAIASREDWEAIVLRQIQENKVYLMVGMECLLKQQLHSYRLLLGGLPGKLWPCQFQIFEYFITNAPICLFIRYRPHVIV